MPLEIKEFWLEYELQNGESSQEPSTDLLGADI